MKRHAILVACCLCFPLVAFADEEGPEWRDCDLGGPPAVAIKGCTTALRASKADEDKIIAYSWRAAAYRSAKKYNEALADLNTAIDIGHKLDTYEDRAQTYVDMGKYDLALADYDYVVSHSVNVSYGSLVRRAEVHERAGHVPQAIADYEAALRRGGTLDSIMAEAQAKLDRLRKQ